MRIVIILIFCFNLNFAFSQSDISVFQKGQFKEIKKIVEKNPKIIYSYDSLGRTPLQLAIEFNNNEKVALFLLNKGAIKNLQTNGNLTVVHLAIKADKKKVLKYFIGRSDTLLNITTKNGLTPLAYSIILKKFDLTYFLISKGANINIASTDQLKITPLFLAVGKNNINLTKKLIDKGANINHKYYGSISIIEYAATIENIKPEIIRILLSQKSLKVGSKELICLFKYNTKDLFNSKETSDQIVALVDNLFHNLSEDEKFKILSFSIKYGDVFFIKSMIDIGFKINMENAFGETPLMLAFRDAKNIETINILIKNGANLQQKDHSGRSMIHFAALNNNINFMQYLISKGFKIDSKDELGSTPLFSSLSRNENLNISKLLVENGADCNYRTSRNETAIYFAAISNNLDKVKLICKYDTNLNSGNKETVFQLILKNCRSDSIISFLVNDFNADVNKTDFLGRNALIIAARENSNPEILKVLISHTKDINHRDNLGRNALLASLSSNYIKDKPLETKILIDSGLNLNEMDYSGCTPLIVAIEKHEIEVAKILIDNGADKYILHGKDNIPAIYYYFKNGWDPTNGLLEFKELIQLGLRLNFPKESNCNYKCIVMKSKLLDENEKAKIIEMINAANR